MNARGRFIAILFAAAGGAAAASPPELATPVIRGFVATPAATAEMRMEAHARTPDYAPPCAEATLTELGHGHADIADAGYATAHCPRDGQAAAAGRDAAD